MAQLPFFTSCISGYFFFWVCDGIFKRASLSYWKLKSANCSCEAPKWATVHVFRLQLRCRCKRRNGGIGREVALEQGGPFFKINCDQFRLLFAFAVKWVERNYGLKDHLTLRLLLYFYRKKSAKCRYFKVTNSAWKSTPLDRILGIRN